MRKINYQEKTKRISDNALKKTGLLFLFLACFLWPTATEAQGGVLYLSPESGIYKIGSSFSVKIMVDTEETSINAGDATLKFNSEHLEVVELSRVNSIFNFWTRQPVFNNHEGTIELAGGTTSQYRGQGGTILSITFRGLANVTSEVSFSSGSLLAADGKATNILTNIRGGSYDLEPKMVIPPSKRGQEPLMIPEGSPLVPIVFSSTHPNEDAWYSNSNPIFSWEIPSEVNEGKFLLDQEPLALPDQEFSSSLEGKSFLGLGDGRWYFHIRFKNSFGWGEVTHRKVLIDTEPPSSFEIKINNGGDPTNPIPVLTFESQDGLSGIDHYEIRIGEERELVRVEDANYRPQPLAPGFYTIIVRAVDKAGNSTTETAELEVSPLRAPLITEYPSSDQVGETLSIKGTSLYPRSSVTVFLKREKEEIEKTVVKTDGEGKWSFVYEESLEKGIYQLWAEVTDERGAKSDPSEKITVVATLPPLVRIGQVAIDYLVVILSLVGLLAILILVIFFTRSKINQWRETLKKETKEAALSVVRGFALLEGKIQEQIEDLDKKPGLNEDEKKIYDRLKKALKDSRNIIGREVEDIEEELK